MRMLNKHALAGLLVESQRWRRDMPHAEAVDIIETLADLIVLHYQEGGESVIVRGFGRLKLVSRKRFVGTNPRTGHVLRVPARKTLSFKPSAEVLRRINR